MALTLASVARGVSQRVNMFVDQDGTVRVKSSGLFEGDTGLTEFMHNLQQISHTLSRLLV